MQAPEPAPIACTLPLEDLGPRLARITQLTRDHLRTHRLEGTVLRLIYDAQASEELARIVELERRCCAFLDFQLSTRGDGIELLIVAPAQQEVGAQWLFAQFLPQAGSAAPAAPGCVGCCR